MYNRKRGYLSLVFLPNDIKRLAKKNFDTVFTEKEAQDVFAEIEKYYTQKEGVTTEVILRNIRVVISRRSWLMI